MRFVPFAGEGVGFTEIVRNPTRRYCDGTGVVGSDRCRRDGGIIIQISWHILTGGGYTGLMNGIGRHAPWT